MIEAKHLIKDYKSKSGVTTKALNDISLKLPKRGMVFILGKSGSGKSTLLNVLGGLDRIDSGEIIIKGKSSADFKQSHFDSYRNTYVGFIFQEYNILDDFTVGQNIALAMKLQNRKPSSEDINNILTQVDLAGLGDRKPNELSGGQKQRVAIARALVKNPQIIMADEPTGALDSATGIQIFDTLKKLSKDKLVLIVSHDREFSERYADRIIELKDGKIISDVENTSKKSAVMEGITCAGNEVIVRQNYELTSKDLKIINAFLKNSKKDISIKTGTGSLSRSSFTNTKEEHIEMDTSGFSLIKSKLPLSHAFKMGTSALKHKKFKLVMTIFLSLVSFTMLGMSATMGFYNPNDAQAEALKKSELNFSTWRKKLITNNDYDYQYSDFTEEEINKVSKTTGIAVAPVYTPDQWGNTISFSNNVPWQEDKNLGVFCDSFSGAVTLSDEYIEKFGIDRVEDSELPTNEDEIAIPYFIAETFLRFGYEEYDPVTKTTISESITTMHELLNKKLYCTFWTEEKNFAKNLTITGIYNTGFDYSNKKYESIIQNKESYSALSEEFNCFARYSFANKVIVSKSNVSNFGKPYALVGTLPNNKRDLRKLCDLSSTKFKVSDRDKEINPKAKHTKYTMDDYISNNIYNITSSFDMMKKIFLYVGLGFILFSGLLLANFIGNSITYQKKEIGILRAIGARGRDVFKIYMSESFVVAMINFVLSTIASYAVITYAILPNFTKMLGGVQLFSFGIVEVALILVVSLVSAFLATFLPVNVIARKKPIDTIRLK